MKKRLLLLVCLSAMLASCNTNILKPSSDENSNDNSTQKVTSSQEKIGEAPKIRGNRDIYYDLKAGEYLFLASEDLIRNTTATDAEDGDLTDKITFTITDYYTGEEVKNLISLAKSLAKPKTNKFSKHGAKPRSARAMIVGIPNVGKSSLINRLAGMNHTKIENKPGVTRAKQWIKIADGLDLLDMPGILYPKFDNPDVALKLSWIYAISDEIHDLEPTVCKLLETLAEKFPNGLIERYKIDNLPADGSEILNKISLKRGCIKKGGLIDTDKALKLVLADFRAGKLGKVFLD